MTNGPNSTDGEFELVNRIRQHCDPVVRHTQAAQLPPLGATDSENTGRSRKRPPSGGPVEQSLCEQPALDDWCRAVR
jgi:hypothetical protein